MSFGVSYSDVVAIIQLCIGSGKLLEAFNESNRTISSEFYTPGKELSKAVNALLRAFGRLQQGDFDKLQNAEREELGEITNVSIDSNDSISRLLKPDSSREPYTFSSFWARENGELGRRNTLLLSENLRDVNEAVRRLEPLLLQIER